MFFFSFFFFDTWVIKVYIVQTKFKNIKDKTKFCVSNRIIKILDRRFPHFPSENPPSSLSRLLYKRNGPHRMR